MLLLIAISILTSSCLILVIQQQQQQQQLDLLRTTGHPFPLKGRYVALIFIHFEPTGHTFEKNESGYYYLRHDDEQQQQHSKKTASKKSLKDINKEYREHSIAGIGGQSSSMPGGLPPYIKRESPEEAHWRQQHPLGWESVSVAS
jgi:hypothetical protein